MKQCHANQCAENENYWCHSKCTSSAPSVGAARTTWAGYNAVTYSTSRVELVQHTVCSIMDNVWRVHSGTQGTQSSVQSAALRTTQEGHTPVVTYPPHRVDSVQHTVCSIVDNKGRVLLSLIPHTGWTQSSTQSAALWTTREGYCCHLSHTQGGLSPAHSLQHCGQQRKGIVVTYPTQRV